VTEIITAMKPLQIQISETVEQNREEYIKFLQELVRIPSLSGEESKVAEYIAEKMMSYGYDIVKVDSLSDVMASIRGSGGGRSILFNGHLDHVPVGDMAEPYSGKIMNGSEFGLNGPVIYGRATSDMKAALSAMVLAGGLLNDMGISLKGLVFKFSSF
jgi:acetylornithine deacetylase/succinyl-diaminopimelate desuccinylase-like protein